MTRLEKIELAIKKGITCNPETGEVFGVFGKVLKTKNLQNYYIIGLVHDNKQYNIKSHQFIWYWVNKEIVEVIDHINRNRMDNRVVNLRSINKSQNSHNRSNDKGFSFHKRENKYRARIIVNHKYISLGQFNTEQEARQAQVAALCSQYNFKLSARLHILLWGTKRGV